MPSHRPVRLIADKNLMNANRIVETPEDLQKAVAQKSRAELLAQLRDRFSPLAARLHHKQRHEADELYQRQRYDWERRVLEEMPQDKRGTGCVGLPARDLKRVRVRQIDIHSVIR